MVCEFLWLLIVLAILKITGIIGGNFGISSPFDSHEQISFSLLEEGLSAATLLNIVLFIPFGFLSTIVLKKLQDKWIYGVLIGFGFSVIIELLQTFTGRFAQLDDVLMNTLGTSIGYGVCIFLKRCNIRSKADQ